MAIQVKEFLVALCNFSEKAAKIARRCRLDGDLFKKLVEEKKGDERNERFFQDFKTLADVLIQELVRFEIQKCYPELKDCIYGEETNVFTNANGESVTLNIRDDKEETLKDLTKILGDDHIDMASLLVDDIYNTTEAELEFTAVPEGLTIDNVGIWIDPIDATNEYVKGNDPVPSNVPGILKSGLGCVTVLLGVFSLSTHEPLIGIVTQPFYCSTGNGYSSKIWWGLSISGSRCNNLPHFHPCKPPTALLSGSETKIVRSELSDSYRLVEAAGAGYKILCAALGLADVSIVSMPTTFKYDTCAPHALLLSQGGNLVEFEGILEEKRTSGSVDTEGYQVTYFAKGTTSYKNEHGLIGFVQESSLLDVVDLLV